MKYIKIALLLLAIKLVDSLNNEPDCSTDMEKSQAQNHEDYNNIIYENNIGDNQKDSKQKDGSEDYASVYSDDKNSEVEYSEEREEGEERYTGYVDKLNNIELYDCFNKNAKALLKQYCLNNSPLVDYFVQSIVDCAKMHKKALEEAKAAKNKEDEEEEEEDNLEATKASRNEEEEENEEEQEDENETTSNSDQEDYAEQYNSSMGDDDDENSEEEEDEEEQEDENKNETTSNSDQEDYSEQYNSSRGDDDDEDNKEEEEGEEEEENNQKNNEVIEAQYNEIDKENYKDNDEDNQKKEEAANDYNEAKDDEEEDHFSYMNRGDDTDNDSEEYVEEYNSSMGGDNSNNDDHNDEDEDDNNDDDDNDDGNNGDDNEVANRKTNEDTESEDDMDDNYQEPYNSSLDNDSYKDDDNDDAEGDKSTNTVKEKNLPRDVQFLAAYTPTDEVKYIDGKKYTRYTHKKNSAAKTHATTHKPVVVEKSDSEEPEGIDESEPVVIESNPEPKSNNVPSTSHGSSKKKHHTSHWSTWVGWSTWSSWKTKPGQRKRTNQPNSESDDDTSGLGGGVSDGNQYLTPDEVKKQGLFYPSKAGGYDVNVKKQINTIRTRTDNKQSTVSETDKKLHNRYDVDDGMVEVTNSKSQILHETKKSMKDNPHKYMKLTSKIENVNGNVDKTFEFDTQDIRKEFTGKFTNGKGEGTMNYKNGYRCTGSFNHGKRHGHSKCTFAPDRKPESNSIEIENLHSWLFDSGVDSSGEAANTRPTENSYRTTGSTSNSESSLSNASNSQSQDSRRTTELSYDGDFYDDKKQGYGKVEYTNNAEYEGNFDDNMKNGQGIFKFPDNDNINKKYDGNWKNDQMDGTGSLTYRTTVTYDDNNKVSAIKSNDKAGCKIYKGSFAKNSRNGIGECLFTFSDDNDRKKYLGQFKNDEITGSGEMTYKSGNTYQGEFKNGLRHGQGRLTYERNSVYDNNGLARQYYEGNFIDDIISGTGHLVYITGEEYNGVFENGQFHGYGTLTFSTNDKYNQKSYAGNFNDGKYHGRGLLIWTTGESFDGAWRNNQRNGRGIYNYKQNDEYGRKSYDGSWKNDQKLYHSPGKMMYNNDDYYVGTYNKYNQREDRGTYYFNKDSIYKKYDGSYHNGEKHGRGKLTYKNGASYDGEYKFGKRAGYGKYIYPDSSKFAYYLGNWLNDRFENSGKFVWRNGDIHLGNFKGGKQHGKGKYTLTNGNIKYYIGKWYKGKLNGNVKLGMKDGTYYAKYFNYGRELTDRSKHYDKHGRSLDKPNNYRTSNRRESYTTYTRKPTNSKNSHKSGHNSWSSWSSSGSHTSSSSSNSARKRQYQKDILRQMMSNNNNHRGRNTFGYWQSYGKK